MLFSTHRCEALLHKIPASRAHKTPQTLGAAELMPMLVLAVVHADLPHGFACVDYLKRLMTPEEESSELGYYLACTEVALTYIRKYEHPSGCRPFLSRHSVEWFAKCCRYGSSYSAGEQVELWSEPRLDERA